MSTTSQLVTQLEAARAQLNSALEAGQPTRAIRADVARLETALVEAQFAADAALSAVADQEAAEVQIAAVALADAKHTDIDATPAVAELAALAPEFAPVLGRDPLIETAAQEVAKAAAALEKAQAAHSDLSDTANKTRSTLEHKKAVLAEVKARRAAGTATPEDALEAVGLPDDIADLERMLAIASEKAAASAPTAEQSALAVAQKQLDEASIGAKLRITRDRLALAEQLVIQLYSDLRAAEKASGLYTYRPSGDYRASSDLKAIVILAAAARLSAIESIHVEARGGSPALSRPSVALADLKSQREELEHGYDLNDDESLPRRAAEARAIALGLAGLQVRA